MINIRALALLNGLDFCIFVNNIQLLTSMRKDIRIYLPEKVIIHRGG